MNVVKKKPTKSAKNRMVATRFGLDNPSDHAAVAEAIRSAARKKLESFPKDLEFMQSVFREFDPLSILTVVGSYGAIYAIRGDQIPQSTLLSGIEQHHIELLQAIILATPRGAAGSYPAHPQKTQEILDRLSGVSEAFVASRIEATPPDAAAEDMVLENIKERVRFHTQAIRNWGYFEEVVETLHELYCEDEDKISKKMGFGPKTLLQAVGAIQTRFDDKVENHIRILRKCARGKKAIDVIKNYFKVVPSLDGTPEKTLDALGADIGREQALAFVMSHCDYRLRGDLNFSALEISNATKLEIDACKSAIDFLSHEIGDLNSHDIERFFLANPVWLKPVIKERDSYFSVLISSFYSHSHYIIRTLYESAGLLELFSERRSKYLEKKLVESVSAGLPDASLIPNAKWQVDGQKFETDLIGYIDNFVVIFEAKSHHVTTPALRGAGQRLRRHVSDLIVEPSIQSGRFRKLISSAVEGDMDATQTLEGLGLRVDQSSEVISICVSLEDLSALVGMDRLFEKAGWTKLVDKISPYISILDLQYIFEILPNQILKIHYLRERQFLSRFEDVLADEMDLLGVYLDNQFNLEISDDIGTLVLSGMSKKIDDYFMSRQFKSIKRPVPMMSNFLRKMLEKLDRSKGRGWLRFGVDLASLGNFEEQKEVERKLKELKRLVRKSGSDYSQPFVMQICPPQTHRTVVLFVAYRPKRLEAVRDMAPELASNALLETDRNRCSLIFCDIDDASSVFTGCLHAAAP